MSRAKPVLMICLTVGWFATAGPFALAQSAPPPAQDGLLKSGPPTWDANRDGIFTCDEWKGFADRIFTLADRNRDGKLDKTEFATVQKADAALADADFGYFDENQDGKIARKEFVDKPSAFIVRFDRDGDCRVTGDEIRATTAPKGPQGPAERPRDRFH
ncbi:EF-hand domain-containing protein [Bradyrhizobium sp. McL0616]|uniref:EF-hand domain-containing protein n=1 Tax=Bradyrhizobium sp. McL0616 TaxID=3415674 RepID=UPI003CFA5922